MSGDAELDLQLARRYARAYAAFDVDVLREILDPVLCLRQINPGGFLPMTGAETYIAATGDLLLGFTDHRKESCGARRIGDVYVTESCMRLASGSSTYLLQHREVVTIEHGRVTAIDGVTTGPRPLADRRTLRRPEREKEGR